MGPGCVFYVVFSSELFYVFRFGYLFHAVRRSRLCVFLGLVVFFMLFGGQCCSNLLCCLFLCFFSGRMM